LDPDVITGFKGDLFVDAVISTHSASGKATGEAERPHARMLAKGIECEHASDGSLAKLLQAFPELRHEQLGSTNKGDEVLQASLAAMAATSARQRTIDLSAFGGLTDVGLAVLASSCGEHCTAIKLRGCANITDNGLLIALATNCHNLLAVELDGCGLITDQALAGLAGAHHQLKRISLNHCGLITDCGVGALARGCPQLGQISLQGCTAVSDRGLVLLARGCTLLEKVCTYNYFDESSLISHVGLRELKERCPRLKTIDLPFRDWHAAYSKSKSDMRKLTGSASTSDALDGLGMSHVEVSKLERDMRLYQFLF
jgi:hypothetical protein